MGASPRKSKSFARPDNRLSRRRFLALAGAAAAVGPAVWPRGANAAKVTMKVAHVLTEADIIHRAKLKFKEIAEKKAGGELEVQIYPNSALGSLRVTWESMQLGNLEGGNFDTVTPAMMVPQYAATELPFIFRDLDHVHKVFDGPIGQDLEKQLMDKAKVRTVAVYDTTFRKIFTKTKAINSLADMKGLKIRVPEAQNYVRCMQFLGANPTPVPWGELYTALQMGVVEGFENKCEAAFNAKLHEQTKFAAYTGHIFCPNPFLCSERWFAKLSKNVQQAIVEGGKESLEWQRKEAPISEKAFEQKLKDAGMTFTSPDRVAFQKAVEPFYKEWGDKYAGNDLIKKIREA
jgi:tripartite ATP-independent transporter DctP family solute receptor